MTNNTTKRALISSAVALALCFVMLVGTTFAWFTDEVSSDNNVIKTGKLDIELYKWVDANDANKVAISESSAPLFGADNSTTANDNSSDTLWEPGKTQTVYLSIKNNGTLDLKYKVAIEVTNIEKGLNEVMEYIITPDAKYGTVTKADLDWSKGIAVNPDTNIATEDVPLTVGGEHFFALSVHMDEYAGNDYQDGNITFNIKVLAAQLASESDSFDNQYDANATYGTPLADVEYGAAQKITATMGMGGAVSEMDLVTSYVFRTTETPEQAEVSPYRWYHADFVVKANQDINPNTIALAGFYSAYCDGYNNGHWVALTNDATIDAGTELRLLQLMLDGGSMNYEELCTWVPVFECGIAQLDAEADLKDLTISVELRLYEVTQDPSDTTGNKNIETGEYITVGQYSYTFN